MSKLWYTSDMNTDVLLRVFGHIYRDGLSLTAALLHENMAKSTYYAWRGENMTTDTHLKLEAQALAAIEVDLERVGTARMREVQQLRIEETLLGGVAPVIEKLLASAAEAQNLQEQVSALRELRQWLTAGIFGPSDSAAEEVKVLAAPTLPDFLAGSGVISKLSVESPTGDKITLERGSIIEGEVTVEKPAPA